MSDPVTGVVRPARPEDIAVLVPARTSLPVLEDAFNAVGVEYGAEASSLVYQAEEVRSLLACARSVADSTDQLALVQVLRSSLFGCGDQARAWAEVSAGGGLRVYVSLASHQGQETRRVAEAVLPEKDVDAVRIMTIHAAKGLEFPIVVLSGMTAQPNRRRGVQLLWPAEGGYAVKLSKDVQAGDFDAAAPVDEQMDQLEKTRLLYVAATRARDHLVVSLHRKQHGPQTAALLLAEAGAGGAAGAIPFVASTMTASPIPGPAVAVVSPPPEFDDWWRGVTSARRASERPSAQSASGLEGTEPEIVLAASPPPAGAAKGARDLELRPGRRAATGQPSAGRSTPCCRWCHSCLLIRMASRSSGRSPLSAWRKLLGQEALVRDLVNSALASPLVQRAAACEHWREQYVATLRDDGTVLEGSST